MHDELANATFDRHDGERSNGDCLGHTPQRFVKRPAQLTEVLPTFERPSRPQESRIAIKVKGSILFINPVDVIAVQAEGNYVLLQRATVSYLLRESISVVEEKFKPYGFIRIHRSVLVNTAFVEEIRPNLTGEYGLRVKGGREYTVTRTYKQNLRSIAEVWIGSDTFLTE
jgi:DNA-binding LytR/AlgR family response regulator